uniref:Uncharacterized protein n=1 Tax=Anopheles atroparvus TaxID=41427 RepID=A0AAG5DD14_ANOAO
MQRSSPLYGGTSVTVPPLLAPLSNAEQQQQQQQHQQHYDTMAHQSSQLGSPSQQLRGTLKRKLPIVELDATRYAQPYSPITDATDGSCGDGGP